MKLKILAGVLMLGSLSIAAGAVWFNSKLGGAWSLWPFIMGAIALVLAIAFLFVLVVLTSRDGESQAHDE